MTTLRNRPNTALVVVDLQAGVVAGAHQRDAVVTNVGALVRGYDATLVADAHDGGPERVGSAAAGPGDRPHESVLDEPQAQGRTAGTVATRDVDFAGPPAQQG
jgi:nicotinamidase-related amidase